MKIMMIAPKMILRSSSTPNFNLCIHRSSSGRDLVPNVRVQTKRPVSMSVSCGSPSPADGPANRISRSTASSELPFPSGALVGGKVGSGSGGGGGNWFDDGHGDPGQGSESMDEYYQKMIEAYPGNALILGNYAKFLKEVKGDAMKAEEYCERAILAKPSDGNALSLYGDLIWQTHKDSDRAETYFDQAVQSAPDDCYVLASYAKFLWDAGEEDELEEDEVENSETNKHLSQAYPIPTPPLTAASQVGKGSIL